MIGDQSSLTAMYLANPQLAGALRRRQFGEKIASGALGTEPIQSHTQGIAKMGQALIGALLMGKADSDFEAQGEKQAKDTEDWKGLVRGLMNPSSPGPVQEPGPQPATQANAAPGMQGGASPQAMAGAGIPAEYMPIIEEAAKRHNIPPAVIAAQMRHESGGNPNAVSPAGATGLMQIMPSTAMQPGYGLAPVNPNQLKDARTNINFGVDYLAAMGRKAGVTDWNDPTQRAKAFQGYNPGDPNYVANIERYMPGVGGAPVMAPPTPGNAPVRAQSTAGAGMPSDLGAEMDRARQLQMLAMQAANHPNPAIKGQAQLLGMLGTQAENRALARQKFLEGGQPDSPERHQQMLERAQAGRPSIENRVAVSGPSEAAKLAAEEWFKQRTSVAKANQSEMQFQMFEKAMSAFDPGAAADIRQSALQALQELGFKNNAPQAELMKSVQRRLELANTPKGEGQITENERALIREALPLFGSTPDGARLLMNATRQLNAYDRNLLKIMNESAKRNGGSPNPVEVAEALQQMPPPLSPALESQIRGGMGQPTAAPTAPGAVPSRAEIEAELARRRGGR